MKDVTVMTLDSMTINQCIVKLIFDRPLSPSVMPKDLRGAIADLRKDNALFHQHTNNKSLIYNYPLIQYKILKGNGCIIGLWKGAVDIVNTILLKKRLNLGSEQYTIEQQEMRFRASNIGICDWKEQYIFLSPWLALNANNYRQFQKLGTLLKRRELLEKILIGNIISMSKGLGYTVAAPIEAHIIKIREVQTSLKGNPMLGFLGTFSVNFEIPDFWGIGKSVSRGFGTVKKIGN